MATPALRVPTYPATNPITDTVKTTATQILTRNENRIRATIVNLSANDGYLGFGEDTSATKGIPVAANGGAVSFGYQEDGDLVGLSMYAINNTASGTWFIVEVVASNLAAWMRWLTQGIGG